MARANFVKKARKDNPAVKKGESYWWWQFMYRPKQYSATRPTRSQTTNSSFLSTIYGIEDQGLTSVESPDEVQDYITEIEDLRDQAQESHDNMPESLQESPVAELLTERVDYLEQWIDELTSIVDQYDDLDKENEEETQSFIDEISSCSYEGE